MGANLDAAVLQIPSAFHDSTFCLNRRSLLMLWRLSASDPSQGERLLELRVSMDDLGGRDELRHSFAFFVPYQTVGSYVGLFSFSSHHRSWRRGIVLFRSVRQHVGEGGGDGREGVFSSQSVQWHRTYFIGLYHQVLDICFWCGRAGKISTDRHPSAYLFALSG